MVDLEQSKLLFDACVNVLFSQFFDPDVGFEEGEKICCGAVETLQRLFVDLKGGFYDS